MPRPSIVLFLRRIPLGVAMPAPGARNLHAIFHYSLLFELSCAEHPQRREGGGE
jgi:hypothetical protein